MLHHSHSPKLLQWHSITINYIGSLPRYVLDRLFDNLMDES